MNYADRMHYVGEEMLRYARDLDLYQYDAVVDGVGGDFTAQEKEIVVQGQVVAAVQAVREGSPVYVSGEMCDLLKTAARTLPDYSLSMSDLPWPSAICWFEQPILTLNLSVEYEAIGAAWTSHEGMVFMSFWGHWTDEPNELVPCGLLTWSEGHTLKELRERSGEQLEVTCRVAAALWLMLQQRVAVTDRSRASRPSRRRWTRLGESDLEDTLVVRLRRPSSESHDDPEAHLVNWTHRWLVDGHWRNQWLPSLQAHRPTWIAPYIKGPDDKPFVPKEKVYVWNR